MSATWLQLKVTLHDVRPLVWRRLLVPGRLTFDGLHPLLQAALGWEGYHLHAFSVYSDIAGQTKLTAVLRQAGDGVTYLYDFGDGWEHQVALERIRSAPKDGKARVLAGARSCPPEDSGGPQGYLYALAQRKNRRRSDLPRGFDPAAFDLSEANERLREVQPELPPTPSDIVLHDVKSFSSRPQNRHLRPHPEALGVTPLAEGELSRPVRVRGSKELHGWLRERSAAELGRLLEEVMQSSVSEEPTPTPRNAEPDDVSEKVRRKRPSQAQLALLKGVHEGGLLYHSGRGHQAHKLSLTDRDVAVSAAAVGAAVRAGWLTAEHSDGLLGRPHTRETGYAVYHLTEAGRAMLESA